VIENLLARLAGGSSWREEQASSAFNKLSVSDIAYCLSGLRREHKRFLETRYLGKDWNEWLAGWLYLQTPQSKYRQELCQLAVRELLQPRLCPKCKGRTEVTNRAGLKKPCDRCKSGIVPWTKAKRARFVGMKPDAWRNWESRYNQVYKRLETLDVQIRRHVKRKLK